MDPFRLLASGVCRASSVDLGFGAKTYSGIKQSYRGITYSVSHPAPFFGYLALWCYIEK